MQPHHVLCMSVTRFWQLRNFLFLFLSSHDNSIKNFQAGVYLFISNTFVWLVNNILTERYV
jgi:hypothetical protein